MENQLQQFINQYYGLSNVGDTPQNIGQCVGVSEVWSDSLNLPHTWGNACDLLKNADPNSFEITLNDPNNTSQYPLPGDIFVYDSTWGEGAGHTGVVCIASGAAFVGFEQNNPKNCRFVVHTYDHLLGWLHPKVNQTLPEVKPEITDQTIIPQLNMEVQAIVSTISDQKKTIDSLTFQKQQLTDQLTKSQNPAVVSYNPPEQKPVTTTATTSSRENLSTTYKTAGNDQGGQIDLTQLFKAFWRLVTGQ